jgi:hypothetical protein
LGDEADEAEDEHALAASESRLAQARQRTVVTGRS